MFKVSEEKKSKLKSNKDGDTDDVPMIQSTNNRYTVAELELLADFLDQNKFDKIYSMDK